jgi:integrase
MDWHFHPAMDRIRLSSSNMQRGGELRMASISKQPNGRKMIQFIHPVDKKRKSIRLGKVSMKQAEGFKTHLEKLVAAMITGHPPDDPTATWASKLSPELQESLANHGLMKATESVTLEPFVGDWIGRRSDVKKSSKKVYGRAQKWLVKYFMEDRELSAITVGDAQEWRQFMLKNLAENTVRKMASVAKQIFSHAVDKGHLKKNPFSKLATAVKENRKRDHFVKREVIYGVIDACPSSEWKLVAALARFGGLRTPSEPFALKWSDINWEKDKIVVHSPKTEHHEGGNCRIIPLFPELKPYLEQCFEEAQEGSVYVVEGLRKGCGNIGPQFGKIIKRAGLKPWPKVFHNLRASRETELADEYPIQVVCDWIGNSPQVASRHYLQTTEEHFRKAMHNPMQQPAEMGSLGLNKSTHPKEKPPEIPRVSTLCRPLRRTEMDDTGLEPVTPTMSTWCSSQLS